jgi:hypothetical protein
MQLVWLRYRLDLARDSLTFKIIATTRFGALVLNRIWTNEWPTFIENLDFGISRNREIAADLEGF